MGHRASPRRSRDAPPQRDRCVLAALELELEPLSSPLSCPTKSAAEATARSLARRSERVSKTLTPLPQPERRTADPSPTLSPADLISEALSKVSFPTSSEAYEFPDLVLPDTNPNRDSVRAARVKTAWGSSPPRPDFLTTRLDESAVVLREFSWDERGKRLSLERPSPDRGENTSMQAIVDLSSEGPSFTSLVAASGVGKTRFIFEQAHRAFGVYVVAGGARVGPKGVGSKDLESFLQNNIPSGGGDENEVPILDRMLKIMFARVAVFRAARRACPGLEPRHWLALQLYPNEILGCDVFRDAVAALETRITVDEVTKTWGKSGLRFFCLDEAQVADKVLPNTFPSQLFPGVKRSALAVLLRPLLDLNAHIVLAGTGLNIQSSYENLASGAAKKGRPVRLVGPATYLDVDGVRDAIRRCGYAGDVDEDTLLRFQGRPRFAMRLAEALIGGDRAHGPARVAATVDEIVAGLRYSQLPRLKTYSVNRNSSAAGRSLYEDVRLAARMWSLKGDGTVPFMGEVALEHGVCTIAVASEPGPWADSAPSARAAFAVHEPLVVQALLERSESESERSSDASP